MEITYIRTWIFYAIVVRQFIDGSEEYFIAPTAWHYIKSLGQNMVFLGLVLSAFQFSALPSSPILGKLADKFGHERVIINVSMFMKFVAYVLYAIPVSAYFPLGGRILGGLTDGSIGVVYGQIILYTPVRFRAQILMILDGVYTLGTLFGPTVSVFLTFKVNILGWKIDAGNSPGIVLALLWLGMFAVSLGFPKEIGITKVTDDDDENDEDYDAMAGEYGSYSSIFLIFYLVILCFFFSSTVTFYTPLLAQENFHLQFIHVKLLFLVSSLFSMILFLLFYLAAEYYDEARLLICSMLMQLSAIILLTIIASSLESSLGVYGGYILLPYICLGMPYFSFSLCCSILSNITDPKSAAFYQSSLIAALHFGNLLGRIVSSNIFNATELLCFCLAQFLCWTFGTVWFAREYKNIRRNKF